MLEWAIGMVRTWTGRPDDPNAGLADAVSNGALIERAGDERFVPRARRLLAHDD
jgi:hypothetical protein